jgi:hypothetical protein
LTRHDLLTPAMGLHRAVQEPSRHLIACHSRSTHQHAQRVLGAHLQQIVEFLNEVAGLGAVHQCRGGIQQRPMAGEPHLPMRPQAALIEVCHLIEGVVATAMRIAGSVRQFAEFSKDGASGIRPERLHQLG